MRTFAQKAIDFHQHLQLTLPDENIEVLNPFKQPEVMLLVSHFFEKYFNDQNQRTFLFGINPGRFGAGITGISFTDPLNLQNKCGIANNFVKKQELSSQFIYLIIDAWGGTEAFFAKFFLSAISPLGFTKNGKNLNYYDEKPLQKSLESFIEKTIHEQIEMGANRKCALCIGGGKNFQFFDQLNNSLKLFDQIIPLDHPRFVMQYRRKAIDQYVKKYLDALKYCESLGDK